ncbi:uncharacterized protein LOC143497197 [Brachyhypopomus gauderio]|uniref:uncharacterized protein LOC143497197 n=1 Tax=Brachyhypopomus gauderio TaxID=698409 RepID=UPI0040434FAD
MEERLIVAVSGCPALYDVSLFIYRDLVKKNEAWQKVSEMVGVPVEECKKRWKNLRDTFRREKTRKRERKRSGAVIGRPWRYMGMMGFLTPFMESRPGSGNMSGGVGEPMTQNSQGEEDQSQGQCEEVKEERREEQDSSDEGATPSTSEPALSAASVPRKRPRQKNISPFEERLLAALQTATGCQATAPSEEEK